MAKSTEQFEITITKKSGTYANGSATKQPLGHPILTRTWNRSDMCTFILHEVDANDATVDLDEVVRGDTILLKIDVDGTLTNAFFGEVLTKKFLSTRGIRQVEIFSMDFLRLGAVRQLDRVIFNQVLDALPSPVDDFLVTPIRNSIRPIQLAEKYIPFGSYDINHFPLVREDHGEISGNPDDKRNSAIIFTAPSDTITGIRLVLWDPDNKAISTSGGDVVNNDPIYEAINVQIQRVRQDEDIKPTIPDPDDLSMFIGDTIDIPNESPVSTRNENIARYKIHNTLKEGWVDATSGAPSGLGDVHLTWTETPTGSGGSSLSFLATGSTAGIRPETFGWNDNFLRIIFDGTNSIGVDTSGSSGITPRTADKVTANRSGSGGSATFALKDSNWVSIQFKISTASDIGAKFDMYLDDGSSDVLVARVQTDSGNLQLIYGDGGAGTVTKTFITGYSTSDDIYIHFRFHVDKGVFEFFYNEAETDFVQVKNDVDGDSIDEYPFFPIQNKTSFTEIPTRVSRWHFFCDGSAAGNLDIGHVKGTELSSEGVNYRHPARWSYIRFDDDPIDTAIGEKYAIRLELEDNSTGNRDRLMLLSLLHIGAGAETVSSESQFTFLQGRDTTAAAGALGWSKFDVFGDYPLSKILDFGFLVETADTWQPLQEGVDYTVDYEKQDIFWGGGTRFGTTLKSSIFHQLTGSGITQKGPTSFHPVRIAEYDNPSTGGIVNSTATMKVGDVFRELNKRVDTNVLTDGWDTTPVIDSSFDSIVKDTFIVKQRSINDALRDLANQHKATFFLSADVNKTLNVEPVTTIESIASSVTPKVSSEDHHYVISFEESDVDALKLGIDADILLSEDEVFTTFIVKGKDNSIIARFVNWNLVETLGMEVQDRVDVFSKEENYDNLWRYAEIKNELRGKNVRKGTIVVDGYFPVEDGRLDTNGIIRVINAEIEDGLDKTGTNNVFKIEKAEYDGEKHMTKIWVSNTQISRQELEDELERQRNLMNGVDPSDPTKQLSITVDLIEDPTSPTVSTSATAAYAALYDEDDNEIDTPGYQRQQCHLFEQDLDGGGTDFRAYSALFPPGVGTIPNDQKPIKKVVLFDAQSGGSIIGPAIASQPALNDVDVIYKWAHIGLHVTIWTGHT